MSINQIIIFMIISLGAIFAFMCISKPFKMFGKVFFNSITGTVLLFVCNYLLKPYEFAVGINLLTAIYTGLLGLPGVVSLYIIKIFIL